VACAFVVLCDAEAAVPERLFVLLSFSLGLDALVVVITFSSFKLHW
jgi:hypothetical protein